jgi:hydroxymethylglutaryl-CoA lyase
MGEPVIINEVGLRDGLQNQPSPVSTGDKARLARALVDAGLRHIEPVSFVHPGAVPRMADAAELTRQLPAGADQHYTALVPNLKGYENARDAGYQTVALVLSTTETFNQRNLNMSLDDAIASCQSILHQANQDGLNTRTYISGAFACPYEGPISVGTTLHLSHEMIEAGSAEIAIADTIGGGNPKQMKDIMQPLLQSHDPERFYIHLHDTRGLAAAMAWAAADLGVRRFDASVGGLGGCPFAPGATGNMATEDLVYMLEACGFDTGVSIHKLREAVTVANEITGGQWGGRILDWIRSQEEQGKGVPVS